MTTVSSENRQLADGYKFSLCENLGWAKFRFAKLITNALRWFEHDRSPL